MRHLKLIGLCVVALFALTAVAAAGSASAAGPEWGACVEAKSIGVQHGHYEDSNCTKEKFTEKKGVKKYSGKYEWKAGAPAAPECLKKKHGNYTDSACTKEKEKKGVPEEHKGKYEKGGPKFTAAAGAGVLRSTYAACFKGDEEPNIDLRFPAEDCHGVAPGGGHGYQLSAIHPEVECATEHATGEAKGSDEVANVSVRFTGCAADGLPATTPGLSAGEIQTSTLKGRLGYINKSATPEPEVGVLLEPATAGGQFAEFELEDGELMLHVGVGNATEGSWYEATGPGSPTGNDGIISPIVPVNQMTHTFTQNYRIEKNESYFPPICNKANVECTYFAEPGPDTTDIQNIPNHFEGGQPEELEDYWVNITNESDHGEGTSWMGAGEELTNTNTVEGEAEIKG